MNEGCDGYRYAGVPRPNAPGTNGPRIKGRRLRHPAITEDRRRLIAANQPTRLPNPLYRMRYTDR